MRPSPDSSTLDPKPPIAASCQIGANIAFSWMRTMATKIFVNLPVKDLKRSMDFFTTPSMS